MKIPPQPPAFKALLDKYIRGHEDALEFLQHLNDQHRDPAPDGRYRHWAKLQHLPVPEGLNTETWWLAIKLARRAFLKDLPLRDPQGVAFRYRTPDILLEKLHLIDQKAAGSLEGQNLFPAEKDKQKFLIRSLKEESISSSQLEGAATTRQEARRMLWQERKPRDKSEQMILNNYEGMRHITSVARHRELRPADILELHEILTRDTLENPGDAGRLRREADNIAVVDSSGQILHDPPAARELPTRLQIMCDFANGKTEGPFMHPVVRAILLHFWLAYDHPFVDGNGRTARALFYWSMARQGYWLIEFISISRLLLRARSPYNRAFLYTETDENDTTYFLLHQCGVIIRAIDELHAYVQRKVRDARRGHDLLRNSGELGLDLNGRQLALLRHALDHPGMEYTIAVHGAYHRVAYQTARTDLLGLEKKDLLIKAKVGREFVFLPPEDLRSRLEPEKE